MLLTAFLLPLGTAFDEGKDFCLFCSLLYCLCLEQCVIHSRCSKFFKFDEYNGLSISVGARRGKKCPL